jgi:hypothetical protein
MPSALVNGAPPTKLWVVAHLGKDGKLTSVSIPQGLGAQQSLDLATEMGKWLFKPAIRNGEAVEVDLLMEARIAR